MKVNIAGMVAALSGAVLLAGCSAGPVQQPEILSRQATVQTPSQAPGNAIGGITDWISGLSAGKKMRCEYGFVGGSDGKRLTTRMFAEKERYRTEIDLPTGMMITLFDGKSMYTWTEGKKQGTRTDMECMKEFAGTVSKNIDTTSLTSAPQTYDSPAAAMQNIPDISCKEATDPVDFAVPSDVQFADQCTILKDTLAKMKEGQHQLPDSLKGMLPQ